jgi:hypothetical protein
MNMLPSLWPGEVASYDAVRRTCRVRIPGITDGSDTLPEAVFSNPLGDRAGETEIRILPGDAVWLMFEGGDSRFPIITGYRTPRAGNPDGWRRYAHANMELTADGVLRLNATTLQINAAVQIVGAGVTHNGVSIGDSHVHPGIAPGPATTGGPQ